MTAQQFERTHPDNIGAPSVKGGIKEVPPPPTIPPPRFRTYLSVILPVTLVVGIIGTIAMLFLVGARTFTGIGLFFPVMALMSMGGMVSGRFFGGGQRKSAGEQEDDRTDYSRDTLDKLRGEAHKIGAAQFKRVLFFHPNPLDLWTIAGTKRMWSRDPSKRLFGEVRLGIGLSESALKLETPKLVERTRREPMTSEMLRRFTAEAPYVRNIPRPLGLRTKPGFAFTGDMTVVHGLIRAALGQLATSHGPDHMGFVVVTQHPERWDWLKWLPHAGDPDRTDGAGRARMVFSSPAEFDAAYDLNNSRGGFAAVQDSGHGGATASDKRHWIVIDDEYDDVDGWDGITRGRSGIEATTFLRLSARPGSGVGWEPDTTFEVTSDGRIVTGVGEEAQFFAHADTLSVHDAAILARALAKWDIGKGSSKAFSAGKEIGFLDAVRMDDPRNPDVTRLWAARENPDSPLRSKFPLGRFRNGTLLEMNLNDVSGIPRGWGGHGIMIGATGSGKSWSLLTYGAGLITTHSADALNLIILDWKGRSFGRRLADAPHTVAVLSNLGKDSEFVERMRDVLEGELQRRQELIDLVNVGRNDIESVDSYERARIKENRDWEPIAELVIIVDEFTELFTNYPEIVEAFVQIGRLGRSLKVRLLLASQVFEESKLKGLEDHIGWKIALRAFNDSASRAFIGTTDAAKIPDGGGGGRGFLKIGEGDLQEIQIFDVGSLWTPPARKVEKKATVVSVDYVKPQQFSLTRVPMPKLPAAAVIKPEATPDEEAKPDIDEAVGALVDVVVAGLKGHKPKHRHEMWLRPLREPFSVEWLYEKCYGQSWEKNYGAHGDPSMIVPIGLVDRPKAHAQDVLTWDLAKANVGLVGEPQTGRTSTTMSAMLSLAMRYSPQQVQFIGLGFGGPGLSMLSDLPHVAGIYGPYDREGVNRAGAEVLNLIAKRQESFPAYGINVEEWRRRRMGLSKGPVPEDGFGEVFFFVDNWNQFRTDYERIHDALNRAMGTSASYGVHIMGTASAWLSGGLQKSVTDNMKLKAELFLSDPSMSEVNRAAAKKIPRNEQDQGTPGRGITYSGEHMMYAYPIGEDGSDAGELVKKIVARAGSEKPARVRNLPDSISLAEVWNLPATPADHANSIRFGLSESDLGPARIDFADTPNYVVLGNTESGRSATIRAICYGIMGRYTPEQASIYMVDMKRDQLGVVMGDHLARYCHRPDQIYAMVDELKAELTARIPADDLDQTQLMAASWEGKRIFVIIDDLSALTSSMMTLDPLADFIDYAKDIGLHVIVGGGTADFMRVSMMSALLGKLMTSQTPGLILDGNKDAGPTIGSVVPERQRKGRGIHVSTKANATNTAALVGWIDPPQLPES